MRDEWKYIGEAFSSIQQSMTNDDYMIHYKISTFTISFHTNAET